MTDGFRSLCPKIGKSALFCTAMISSAWIGSLFAAGDMSPAQSDVVDVVMAQKIILVDGQGRSRVILSNSDIGPSLKFLDSNGSETLVVGRRIFGEDDENVLEVIENPGESGVFLFGKRRTTEAKFSIPDWIDVASVVITGAPDGERDSLELGMHRAGVLEFYDESNRRSLELGVDIDGPYMRQQNNENSCSIETKEKALGLDFHTAELKPALSLLALDSGPAINLFHVSSSEDPQIEIRATSSGPILKK